jgi:hypothetical protein
MLLATDLHTPPEGGVCKSVANGVNSHYSAKPAFFHARCFGVASRCEALRSRAALDFAPICGGWLGNSIHFLLFNQGAF